MRKDRNLGILLSTVLFLPGPYFLHESIAKPQCYIDSYILTGAAVSAIGLITGSWAIQRHVSIRRLEQYAEEDQ